MTIPTPAFIPEGYRLDGKGRLVPENQVPEEALLEDQTVRKILGFARELSEQVARFKGHTFDDLATFLDLLAEKYGAKRGGAKGNFTLKTFDDTMKVVVQVQDRMTFGPSLQVAKSLFDECIEEWASESRDEIKTLVQHAFEPSAEGLISREKVFALRKIKIEDERWKRGVDAINDSIRIEGSKAYVRFYVRDTPNDRWSAITIDLASAELPEDGASKPEEAA